MNQVIHVDYMCNECSNCKSFCPYASAPYKDKFTLFASEADMADSTNDGFAVINPETKSARFVSLVRFPTARQMMQMISCTKVFAD